MIFLDENHQMGKQVSRSQQSSVKAVLAEQRNLNPNQIVLGNGSDRFGLLLGFCRQSR
jgi:histidinol-phosphate aminotransferase